MATTITIGRAPTNDIVVGDAFPTVSNNHADLTLQDDGRLRYTDHSSNGTVINGLAVNNKSMFVTTDDNVRLADSFPIDWTVVYRLMPELQRADSKRTRRLPPRVPQPEAETPAEEPAKEAPVQEAPVQEPPVRKYDATSTVPIGVAKYAEAEAEKQAEPKKTVPFGQAPAEEETVSRGTERFDRSQFERRDSGNLGANTSHETRAFVPDQSKTSSEQKPAKRRRSSQATRRGSSTSTIVLCIVAFLAVMAILAFTVFDDVVKNIM